MWQSLIESVTQGGPVATLLLLGLVVAIVRRWLVPGWWHRETVEKFESANSKLEAALAEKDATIAALLSRNRDPVS